MKCSKLIERLAKLMAEHGDLEVFDTNSFSALPMIVDNEPNRFPEDWAMPSKFIEVGSRD